MMAWQETKHAGLDLVAGRVHGGGGCRVGGRARARQNAEMVLGSGFRRSGGAGGLGGFQSIVALREPFAGGVGYGHAATVNAEGRDGLMGLVRVRRARAEHVSDFSCALAAELARFIHGIAR
jgi:hypothetical protein